jgi:outer membrane protein assembly factor BamB
MKRYHLFFMLVMLVGTEPFGGHTYAADWPQFRGIHRDGHSPETGLLPQWLAKGPDVLWTATDCGKGFASPAVVSDIVYITGTKDDKEFLSAYDAKSTLLWRTTYGSAWTHSFPDTRTTPTIDAERAYVISGTGEIVCLNIRDGDILWKVDGATHFKAKWGRWGCAESPLVFDNKVIFTPGGNQTTIVALNKLTGETVWQSRSLQDQCAYVSPVYVQHQGSPYILSVSASFIYAVHPADGDMTWIYDYKQHFQGESGGDINTNSPIYHHGSVYTTSGYDHGGIKLNVSPDGNSVSLAWVDPTLDVHHGHVVLVDGYLYGANWLNNYEGNWVCVNWETGKPAYETPWQNKGSIIYADGMLYCYDEKKAMIGLVKATPQKFDLVSQFKAPIGNGQAWAHPAISNGKLYIRRGNGLMVFNIKK